MDALSNPAVQTLLLAILGSAALISLFNDALAQAAARVPVVGGLLAWVVRRLTPAFWAWLETAVKESAERAVRTADALSTASTSNESKKLVASAALERAQPGLSPSQIDKEIEAALARVKTDAARAVKKLQSAAAPRGAAGLTR